MNMEEYEIKQKHGYHLFSLHCVLSYPIFNLDHLWVLLNKTKLYQILSRPTICYTAGETDCLL